MITSRAGLVPVIDAATRELRRPGDVIAVGESPLECRLVDFRNSQYMQTLPDCTPGRVVVVGPTPVRPASWGRLKALYR